MNCLFWSCRGLGVPLTILTLGDIIRTKNLELAFLLETKCMKAKVESLKKQWNLFGIAVERVGGGGGLAMLWRKDIQVDLLS